MGRGRASGAPVSAKSEGSTQTVIQGIQGWFYVDDERRLYRLIWRPECSQAAKAPDSTAQE
jgi:hypothetical protein